MFVEDSIDVFYRTKVLESIAFRAIFDLLNKIALSILLWIYALYVKKKQKFKNWLKSDIFSSI